MNLEKIFSRCLRIDGCLEWQGALNTDGYPRGLMNGNNNAKLHREVFFLIYGYYPPVVRHSCDNIKCLDPGHLLGGDPLDNVKDRHERNRTFKQVNQREIWLIEDMRYNGQMTYNEIAKAMNMTYKRVEYIINTYIK